MTNFKVVFGLLCCVVLSYQVEMKIWDQAGEYTLKPEDYGYSNNIIIQLWGAGSGSSKYSFNNGYPETYQSSGSSGAYINAKIDTTNQETFYFTLGVGGNCSYCTGNNIIGYPGNYSLFYSNDKELFLNVSGGKGSCCESGALGGIVNSTKHRADDIILGYCNGTSSTSSPYNYLLPNQSPFGPPSDIVSAKTGNKCDGYMGSGSNYGCCGGHYDTNGRIIFYKGGDGALVIYF